MGKRKGRRLKDIVHERIGTDAHMQFCNFVEHARCWNAPYEEREYWFPMLQEVHSQALV